MFTRKQRLRGVPRTLRVVGALSTLLLALVCIPTAAQEPQDGTGEDEEFSWLSIQGVDWHAGPVEGVMGTTAAIGVPDSFVFTDGQGTQMLMQMMQNPTSGAEMGFIAPVDDDWFVVFEFDDVGYVKDDDKDDLDPDELLEALRAGQQAGNKIRAERGWDTLELLGWAAPPHYDEQTNNLAWATKIQASDGSIGVNYNTRLLGRNGVMSAVLVVDPERLDEVMPAYRTLITRYGYQDGQRYAEFTQGDKVAKYGLAALVTGGAAALAVKTGLFKKLWKPLALGAAALLAALRKMFGRGKTEVDPDSDSTPA
ncbi:MAG: DUF2167 domain-containing protein [bacterium]|nr:DUF2167 domain-containing protein [bacterium]